MGSPAPQPFVIEEYVRWSDVDFAGIIFYGSYVRLFEIAEYVAKVGTKSLTLHFDVLRTNTASLGAAGWMVLVCVDRKQLKPRPLPAGLIRALAPHTLSPETARSALGVQTSAR